MTELKCELNPGLDDLYLQSLNVAFGHWGDRKLYEWVFERSCGSFDPDQIVLSSGGDVIAGSGVSYRKLGHGSGAIDVGIMTGSWTLPAARGMGCFKRIIDESVNACRTKDCGLLLAFVTHDNPSRYALEKAGSALFESRYVFASDVGFSAPLQITGCQKAARAVFEGLSQDREDSTHFVYPSFEDFEGQMLQRAFPVELISVGEASVFVEKTPDTDRIVSMVLNGEQQEAVFESVAVRAANSDRKFFGFWMGNDTPARLGSKQGFLTALMANPSAVSGVWDVDKAWSGDSIVLADPKSDWFLGRFRIDSGDRM